MVIIRKRPVRYSSPNKQSTRWLGRVLNSKKPTRRSCLTEQELTNRVILHVFAGLCFLTGLFFVLF